MIQTTAAQASKQVIDNISISNAATSTSKYASGEFFEFLWRTAGLQFIGLLVVAYLIFGYQPGVGASADSLVAFYSANSARIVISAVFGGLAVLNLMWFAAALRTTLEDLGQDGWGAAATAASAAVGVMLLLIITANAGLAFSIAGSGNNAFLSGLNDLSWALLVLSSFPRAMLIMSAVFGFWRAGVISNALFAIGVGAVVLGVAGGTTWIGSGAWAPDGIYSRYVWPAVGLASVVFISWILLKRSPARGAGW